MASTRADSTDASLVVASLRQLARLEAPGNGLDRAYLCEGSLF